MICSRHLNEERKLAVLRNSQVAGYGASRLSQDKRLFRKPIATASHHKC